MTGCKPEPDPSPSGLCPTNVGFSREASLPSISKAPIISKAPKCWRSKTDAIETLDSLSLGSQDMTICVDPGAQLQVDHCGDLADLWDPYVLQPIPSCLKHPCRELAAKRSLKAG